MLVGHLHIIFGEMFIRVLCSLLRIWNTSGIYVILTQELCSFSLHLSNFSICSAKAGTYSCCFLMRIFNVLLTYFPLLNKPSPTMHLHPVFLSLKNIEGDVYLFLKLLICTSQVICSLHCVITGSLCDFRFWVCFVFAHIPRFVGENTCKVWFDSATLNDPIKVEMSKEQYFNLASKGDINLALLLKF